MKLLRPRPIQKGTTHRGKARQGSTQGASLAYSPPPAPPLPGRLTDSWMVVMTVMVSAVATRARCMVQRTSSHSPAEGLPKASPGPWNSLPASHWLPQGRERTTWRPGLPGHRHHACADSAPRILPEPSMPATGPTTWTCPREAATIAFPGFSHMPLRTQ